MSDIGILVTVTCGFVVQLCTIAILYCMTMENRQIERRQRAILDAIFAKLLEGRDRG